MGVLIKDKVIDAIVKTILVETHCPSIARCQFQGGSRVYLVDVKFDEWVARFYFELEGDHEHLFVGAVDTSVFAFFKAVFFAVDHVLLLQTVYQVLKAFSILKYSSLLDLSCDEAVNIGSDLYFLAKTVKDFSLNDVHEGLDLHDLLLAFVDL